MMHRLSVARWDILGPVRLGMEVLCATFHSANVCIMFSYNNVPVNSLREFQ